MSIKRSLGIRAKAPQDVVRGSLVSHLPLEAYCMPDPVLVHERR